jgi:cytochrome c biogenesis protein CcdA
MKVTKTIIFIVILLRVTFIAHANQLSKLMVFHSPGCHRCVEVKKEIMPGIEAKYKEKIAIEYYDITDINNHKFLLGLKDKYDPDIKEFHLPVFFMQGKFLNTKADLGDSLRNLIDDSLANLNNQVTSVNEIDLTAHFRGFRPLVILGSGLVDGINPCAFTVIVFFISYLALQGYRKKELVAIGLSFILSVFVTYSLIGLGIFNFLYRMKSFWLFVRIFNISVGIFSIILGVFALYDLFKFIKTRDTQGLILQLPKVIKNRIHSVISLHYRKSKESSIDKPRVILSRLVLSALITGFLVSILEAVCTGQLYLPTIAFVLKTTTFKLQALAYLVIYNIMFILPLLVIFLLALFGVTSVQFANFLKKNLAGVKVIMAFVFFSLGIFLIWRG